MVLKIGFVDFWDEFNMEYNFFTLLLSIQNEIIVDHNEPDILFYSVFGNMHTHSKYEHVFKVYFTGENKRPPIDTADYCLGFDYLDVENYTRLPLWMLFVDFFDCDVSKIKDPGPLPINKFIFEGAEDSNTDDTTRDRFCSFIASNPNCLIRNRCFELLSTYKHVDSAGKFRTNTTELINMNNVNWSISKNVFLKKYKFNICFENSSYPGYFTEKLMQAKLSGTIPIYWGDPKVIEECNPNSFINYSLFKNDEDFINEIKRLDTDDIAYKKIRDTPLFSYTKEYYMNILIEICKKIISAYNNRGFVFIPQQDQMNCDLFYKNGTIPELKKHAIANKECVAFNTLGYFKSDIIKLEKSPYFKSTDGIYIKKQWFDRSMLFKSEKTEKTAYICGCIKNNAKTLMDVFQNIDMLTTLFANYKIVIAYDNSNDGTLEILIEMSKKYNIVVLQGDYNMSHVRVVNITNARNTIMNYLRTQPKFQYIIMMDLDEVSSYNMNLNVIEKVIDQNDWDAISFYSMNYYDYYALSIHPYVYNYQCWGNSTQADMAYVIQQMKTYLSKKMSLIKNTDLLECRSAFNGFAIYRYDCFINCNYDCSYEGMMKYITETELQENSHSLLLKFNLFNKYSCEHCYFHAMATANNNAKIRISPLCLFNENLVTNTSHIIKKKNNFIHSRGILNSCNIKSLTPHSSIQYLLNYDFSTLKNGDSVYICGNAIKHFIKYKFKTLQHKIILVSGDCDETIPDDVFESNQQFLDFISSENIIHWFSQNCVGKHEKLSQIPIGLDYHTLLNKDHKPWGSKMSLEAQENQIHSINNRSAPFWQRDIKCYSNFHFFTTTRFGYDRLDAIAKINKELVYYEPQQLERLQTWINQSKYAFVISPHGNGLDCHRTWEALCLGCIPIVKASKLDALYDQLPVLIVNEWSDINIVLLTETIEKFKTQTFCYDKLYLDYWMKQINKSV